MTEYPTRSGIASVGTARDVFVATMTGVRKTQPSSNRTPSTAGMLTRRVMTALAVLSSPQKADAPSSKRFPARNGAKAASENSRFVATNLEFSDAAFAPFLAGNLLLLGASAFWGLDNTASAVITRRVSIPAVLGVRLLLGCVFLTPVIVATNTSLAVPTDAIPLLVGYSVLTIVVYATALYYAFRTIVPLRSGAVLSTSALWGVLFAILLFPTQLPSGTQLAGGAVMVLALIGLYLLGEPRSAEGPPTSEALSASARDGPRSP